MTTVPVITTFPAGTVASSAALTAASAAAQWLAQSRPVTQLTQTSAQAFPAATATAVQWAAVTDRDSGFSGPSQYIARTSGFYLLAASVTWTANATGARQLYFTVTTGSGNPAGAGITTGFGLASAASAGSGIAAQTVTGSMSPYLYAGDYVQVLGYQSSGSSLATSAAQLCACFISLGP
jgi:hypothetical protein